MIITDADLERWRALGAARPGPEPGECGEGCEHIECAYVVRLELWQADRARSMAGAIPVLIEEVERLRAPEAHWDCHQRVEAVEIARDAARAAVERMRPVVEAACAGVDGDSGAVGNLCHCSVAQRLSGHVDCQWQELADAVDAYRATNSEDAR
jgi:hypothetical protein